MASAWPTELKSTGKALLSLSACRHFSQSFGDRLVEELKLHFDCRRVDNSNACSPRGSPHKIQVLLLMSACRHLCETDRGFYVLRVSLQVLESDVLNQINSGAGLGCPGWDMKFHFIVDVSTFFLLRSLAHPSSITLIPRTRLVRTLVND